MTFLRNKFSASPILARVIPFVVFVLLTGLQEQFGQSARYWFYFVKTVIGAWCLWEMRPFVPEMKWRISSEAVVIGVAVFALWVGLDRFYPHFGGAGLAWNPHTEFGNNSGLAWFFMGMRIIGMTFIVPPLEEVFFRSFLYRYIAQKNFLEMPLREFQLKPFLITSVLFGFEHHQWLAGILAGLAYQWLTIRKGRLGDAISAHAITNFLLASWVVWKGAWNFF
jgi:CAAX prenyl protease-like protein